MLVRDGQARTTVTFPEAASLAVAFAWQLPIVARLVSLPSYGLLLGMVDEESPMDRSQP